MSKFPVLNKLSWLSISRRFLTLALLCAFTVGFFGCEKDSEEAIPTAPVSESTTLKRLLGMGFAKQNIEDKGDYYLVEGDIIFHKEAPVPVTPSKPGTIIGQQNQAHTSELISYSKQPNITVRVDASIPTQWQDDIFYAIFHWNSILGSRVDLTLTNASSADITFKLSNNIGGAYAQAEFPANGNPGFQVQVNPNIPSNLRMLIFVHELGHCFGLRHTDLFISGEGPGSDGATVIRGTPTQDPNSVMNSGRAPNQVRWNGFSEFDVIGFQNLYPAYYKITAQHSGKALVVSGGSLDDEAPIIQYTYYASGNDEWRLDNVGGGFYKIINRRSGKALVVKWGSLDEEAPIIQFPYYASRNDEWTLEDMGWGYRVTNRNSGLALAVKGGSFDEGAPIIQSRYIGNLGNQVWSLLPVD